MEKHDKYQKSKIYKVIDSTYSEFYIGSTIQHHLCNRMASHRANYKYWRDGKYANCSVFRLFDKYGLENCKIELLELYPCDNMDELRQREGYWIKREPCINKRIAGRSDLEYSCDMREKHKEKITCSVCSSCFRKTDKARHEKTQRHLTALENNK
jgi:hypothetical protein